MQPGFVGFGGIAGASSVIQSWAGCLRSQRRRYWGGCQRLSLQSVLPELSTYWCSVPHRNQSLPRILILKQGERQTHSWFQVAIGTDALVILGKVAAAILEDDFETCLFPDVEAANDYVGY